MTGPIKWLGGKGRMAPRIVPLLPPHRIYVEPFGGGASVLLAKPPSAVEVYNDTDSGLVGFFRVLRDPQQFAELHRLASLTPCSREEYNHCRDTWREPADPVELAYRWMVVARMSFGGRFGASWGSSVTTSRRGMAETASGWLAAIDGLPAVHARLMRVQVEHADWRVILERYDTPQTCFYLDPPYMPETRRSGGYAHELTTADHAELVQRLLGVAGHAVLSGYPSNVYVPLTAAGWRRYDFETACHAVGRTRASGILGVGAARRMQARTECLWISPTAQRQRQLFTTPTGGKHEP